MGDEIIIKGSSIQLREGRFNNPSALLVRIGAMQKGRVQGTFQAQGRDGVAWLARRVPNVAGIVMDANKGARSIPNRRFQARPAGIDTNYLARSINYGLKGNHTVKIGSTVQYANKVHRGGTTVIPVTPQAKQILAGWIKGARKGARHGSKDPAKKKIGPIVAKDFYLSRLGFLLNPKLTSIRVSQPARPFAFFSERDQKDIEHMAREFFVKPAKKP